MKSLAAGILCLSLGVAGVLALWASAQPDGLEHTMEQVGMSESPAVHKAPMPDYALPGEGQAWWRSSLPAVAGTLLVFGLGLLVGWALKRAGGRRVKAGGEEVG